MSSGHPRSGLSLIEILVTLSVIGLLLALVLPAVQSIRETQRRQICQARLGEIGRATQAYEGVHQTLPSALAADERSGKDKQTKTTVRYIAPHVRLLPYLDQSVIFDQLNLQQRPLTPPWDAGLAARLFALQPASGAAAQTRVPVFLCPSDYSPGEQFPGNNYRANLGPGPGAIYSKGSDRGGGLGPFAALSTFGPQDLTDGAGQTIGWSERLRGSWQENTFAPRLDTWYSNLSSLLGRGPTLDEIAPVCASLTGPPGEFYPHGGGFWFFASYDHTWYNHGQSPNSKTPGCASGAAQPSTSIALDGVYGPSSNHAGGVSCVFMDGHTGFMNEFIDTRVWRALSTRGGLEQVGQSF